LLRRCLDRDVQEVVLEVTSHGIFQYRIWGIDITLAGITNITNEHLDYFKTWDIYAKAKSRLLERANLAVLNADDRSFGFLSARLQEQGKTYLTYTQEVPVGVVGKAIKNRFAEQYNQWNATLVWTMAKQLGVTEEVFVQSMESFPGVKGRMQYMPNNRGLNIVVDFAHTPNALESALTALKPQTKGKLIAVFGCAGLRDHTKRPAMGRISTNLADLAVFTAEDPRTEDIQVIFRQMKEGVDPKNLHKVMTIPDRGEAIAFAFAQAEKGDTIGIFGKGHEMSMCWGKTEYPWSDQVAVQKLLSGSNSPSSRGKHE
jgi:UDP-N-acetylmuramoyl-L-alanyl-D-glutamate--2,6-diaminopimelate ligase